MEIENPESLESDPESDRSSHSADFEGQEEGEESGAEEEHQDNVTVDEEDWETCSEEEEEAEGGTAVSSGEPFHNSSRLLHKDELLEIFKATHSGPRCKEEQLTIGLVGKTLHFCLD